MNKNSNAKTELFLTHKCDKWTQKMNKN